MTTDPSSPRTPLPTGASSTFPQPCSSTRAHLGRTRGSSRSTHVCATNFSTASALTHCSRPRCSARTGATNTIPNVSTVRSAISRRSNLKRRGSSNTNNDSHWLWLTKRGPHTMAFLMANPLIREKLTKTLFLQKKQPPYRNGYIWE